MIRAWKFAVCALFVAGPAAAHDLTCDLGIGLAAKTSRGAPSLAMDGRPLMIAPAASVLDVDAYPALLEFRVVVTNVADAPSVMTGLEGDPAARAGPGSWIFGSHLVAGLTLPVGGSADQHVIVPVASQAECVALGGEPYGAPLCRADGSDGARVLVKFDRGQAECRAKFRCGPDSPTLPSWSGARQFGWESSDTAHGLALDPHGELHLVGQSFVPSSSSEPARHESVLASITPDGTVRPVRPGFALLLKAAAADGTGAVTFAGWGLNGAWGSFVRKVARDGTVIWERSLDTVYAVAAGPGGTVVAASLDWERDAHVMKFGATGDVVWDSVIATPREDRPTALALDAEGNIYVTGQVSDPQVPPTAADVFVARLDAGGSVEWIRNLATEDFDQPSGIAVNADGIVAVGGYSISSNGATQPWVVAYDRAGAPLWRWNADSPVLIFVSAVAADPEEGFWVGLSTMSAVVRLASDGSELWMRYHGPFGSSVSDIALDAAGDAYVVGSTSGDLAGPSAGSNDIFVIRLGPDGYP